MGEFSLTHILLVLVIILIFFGPSRLPQLGQSLGKAIRGFKEGINEINAEAKEVKDPVKESTQQSQHSQQIAKNEEQSATATAHSIKEELKK